ncbi:hypothetical protein [Clostridium sp.]|uniref:hypothetical protein n=1 Tax=Clostridium sp. TaxID=1506 RepID=UPI0032164F73
MEAIGYIFIGILAMAAPTLAIVFLCGVFKLGGLFGAWLDMKKVELENKRKSIEER